MGEENLTGAQQHLLLEFAAAGGRLSSDFGAVCSSKATAGVLLRKGLIAPDMASVSQGGRDLGAYAAGFHLTPAGIGAAERARAEKAAKRKREHADTTVSPPPPAASADGGEG